MQACAEPMAFILPSLAHGGAQQVTIDLVRHYSDSGRAVSLLVLDKEGELLSSAQCLKPIFFDGGSRSVGALARVRQIWQVRRWLKDNNTQRLYSTITGMNIFACVVALLLPNLCLVLREATPLENHSSKMKILLMKLFYRRASYTICTSLHVKEQFTERKIGLKNGLRFLPNPLAADRIFLKSQASVPTEYARILGNSSALIVSVGRLIRAKGYDVLIEAVAQLVRTVDLHLLIIGDGPEKSNLQQMVRHLGVSDRVTFSGYSENPYPYMKQADVFVLSSRWEGYVNTVVEAMVLGKKMVLTDCSSGPGEALRNRLGMKLVAVDDPIALAVAIEEALQLSQAPDYGEILQDLTMDTVAKRYLELI